jgi:hypothetical protein
MKISQAIAVFCSALLIAQSPYTFAQQPPSTAAPATSNAQLGPGQLDSLVAPIALYPDQILSQVLVASTYPLEIVEAQRWLKQNSQLSGQALADAAKKQSWDPSIQAMVLMPDVLKRMDENVSWTSDLGNAFLAQQEDVMQAIQRMRQKAQSSGALQTTAQQTVSTTTENGANYIVIEPASPEVVYVPQYNPEAIWGASAYPYPPVYYPPYGGALISFGTGLALGAIWGGGGWGGWGWNCGWGHGNIYVNRNWISHNHFNNINNIGNGNRWVHNPAHRRDVPYANRAVAGRFQNANITQRPNAGQIQRQLDRGGIGTANRMQGGGVTGGGRGGVADRMNNQGLGQRGGGVGSPAIGGANRVMANPGGGDRIGNRNIGGGAGQGAFGGINQGGDRTRMNMDRGSRSFGGGGFNSGGFNRGGGGMSRGGGGMRGGGRRR